MIKRFVSKVFLKIKIEFLFLKKRVDKTVVRNESINKNYIKKFLPARPVIIDAGAHTGGDSIEMCRLYPSSFVHCFEPIPSIFKMLKHNTRKYKRISCHEIALSNTNGEQVMNVSSGASDGSSSFLKPMEHLVDHPDVYFKEEIKVKTIKLDDWAAQNNIDKIDFLWLDMQGFEMEVLKASSVILPKVKAIHMEVSTRPTYKGVPLYTEVKEWMQVKGFRVEVEAIPKGWDMGNVLFVRNQ
ncbi:MAG TPA: FkbM family methyltransferase [Chitinophagaceae bacterium]|nr:FkbM family methyltransferase [Chitinophagaceae bacterium]